MYLNNAVGQIGYTKYITYIKYIEQWKAIFAKAINSNKKQCKLLNKMPNNFFCLIMKTNSPIAQPIFLKLYFLLPINKEQCLPVSKQIPIIHSVASIAEFPKCCLLCVLLPLWAIVTKRVNWLRKTTNVRKF